MPTFAYTARTTAGEKTDGTIEAPDRRSALTALERRGMVPVSVREGGGASSSRSPKSGTRTRGKGKAPKAPPRAGRKAKTEPQSFNITFGKKKKMAMREVLTFTRELGDLINSGMTLGNALNSLSRRKTNPVQDEIIAGLRDEIIKGASLSDALGGHRETFSNLYISMVRAGEASGEVPEALERLAQHYERIMAAREKVIGALTYPLIVMIVGFITIIFTMTFVIPKFSKVFAELGATLPLPTRMMIGFSSFLLAWGWLVAILVVVGVIAFNRWIRTESGELWWHRQLLRMPIAHRIITSNAYAQFARTLSALLNNGVPVLQALSIVENTMGNQVIAREIHEARERVTDGSTISKPLAAGKVFPQLLTDMLAVGEESGDMAGALGHIAKRYDDDLDRNVKILTTVLEPIMILGIAVGVGFVAISMLMAVFELTSGLNI